MKKLTLIALFGCFLAPAYALALDPLPAVPDAGAAPASDDKAEAAKPDDKKDAAVAHKAKKHRKAKLNKVEDVDEVKSPAGMELGDRRIKMMLYDETDVYTIKTRYGYQTNIVFAPNEEIQLISVGDRSLWQIIPNGNRLFIRPMEEDVVTNMTVLTSKHSYQFDLKSLASGESGNIYVAQFIYGLPQQSAPALPAAALAPVLTSSPFAVAPSLPPASPPVAAPTPQLPAAPNYRYTFSGPDELAPLQVYDDGRATYLTYRDPTLLSPSVFMVDKAGHETPVTSGIRGDTVKVDAVAGELAVKSGGGTVHVFNEMLNPE